MKKHIQKTLIYYLKDIIEWEKVRINKELTVILNKFDPNNFDQKMRQKISKHKLDYQ